MHKLKDLQMNNGDEVTLLGIGRVLGATLESVAQGGSSITKAIVRAIHDTLNGVGDLDEKVMGSLGDAASKVIESTGHTVKDSTTGISNMFHGVLGGIEGTIQWCLILATILVLLYINHFTLLKLCGRKPSGSSNAPTTPLSKPSTDSDSTRNRLDNPTCTPDDHLRYLWFLPVLHYVMFLTHKRSVVIPITMSSQNDHVPCSALVDTGSLVTLPSETLQGQLNFPATPLDSRYHSRWGHQ